MLYASARVFLTNLCVAPPGVTASQAINARTVDQDENALCP